MGPINVFARWRPLSQSEAEDGDIHRSGTLPVDSGNLHSVSITPPASSTQGQVHRPWTSPPAFHAVFEAHDSNRTVYNTVVAPSIPRMMLHGDNCSFFAYGHSGSGKTHTILGYDFADANGSNPELGLCLAAARDLFDALHEEEEELGVGFSLFELRRKCAFDLLNDRRQCHVREGPDGKVHVRGETEVLEGGKVRVRPIVQRACWDFEAFRRELVQGLGRRSTGSSSVHDESSRTHAVLELEVVNQPLVDKRAAWLERQAELVPVGKRAIDVKMEEDMRSVVRTPQGGWMPNPEYVRDDERVDAAEAEKGAFEARVRDAEEEVQAVLQASDAPPCLGAKMVFVDLAGAEYMDYGTAGRNAGRQPKQTPQERQEGRQINSDLLALKEVMRAWSDGGGQKRIPFRSSTLTMVLREHFLSKTGSSSVIVTVSPAAGEYAATMNSLKYASLVGAAV